MRARADGHGFAYVQFRSKLAMFLTMAMLMVLQSGVVSVHCLLVIFLPRLC